MSKIKSLPTLERPREKAFYYGVDKLSDHELLAILIGSGTVESSSIDIAYKMLQDSRGLYHLVQKPFSDLLAIKGIGPSKAVKIMAAFEIAKRFNSLTPYNDELQLNSNFIYEKYKHLMSHFDYETIYLLILNRQKKVIHEVNLCKGNESSVSCSWRQIIQQVLIHSGKYLYLIHNHPSGDHSPSQEDIVFTTTLIKECQKLNIRLLDHIIISSNGYFSFLENLENKT